MPSFTVIEGSKKANRLSESKKQDLSLISDLTEDLVSSEPIPCRPATEPGPELATSEHSCLRRAIAKLQAASREQRDIIRDHRDTISSLRDAWDELHKNTQTTVETYQKMDLESAANHWRSTARAFGRVSGK